MGTNDIQFGVNLVPHIDPGQLTAGINQIQAQFAKLKLPKELQSKMSGLFSNAAQEAEKFQSILNGKFRTKKDLFGLEKIGDSAVAELEKIRAEMDKISDIDLAASVDTSTDKFKRLDQQIEQLSQKISQAFNIDDEVGQTGQKIKEVVSNAVTELEKISKAKVLGKGGENDFSKALLNEKDVSVATQELFKMIEVINNFKEAQDAAIPEIQAFKTALQAGNYKDAINALESIKDNTIALGKSGHTVGDFATQMKTLTEQTKALSESNLDSFIQKKKELEESKQLEFTNELERARTALEQGKINLDQYTSATKKYITEQQQAKQSQMNFNNEIDQLKNRVQYFFGLTNAVQLFRRALQSTFNTVKDLDASMTETAVVTDFTVGDMWNQLPQYTVTAKEFGVTIKGVYDVMTLYYQQGLDQNAAWQLGTETLKLARIAGLDYAEATDRMTNALRGFNMELNEQNAQRVDDVYSKLAAMSASNVDELSIAMTKTASIAKSANMDFEKTAAFLAQIIETTREAPETAGTALKTVIARFSEVKELYTKGQLTGEDSEGEAIDVNKVSKALKTAGVDMNKYFLGEVGLDDIFMELASKWDSLDLVQQRYIATQAAGSRQQSRFIAMLSDYSRTLELVEGAENANGASSQQFEKTQESLENKLNRLKDTWQEFLMGIANSSAIKTGIDLLNGLLTIVNKLTTGFGPLSNSILKVGAAIATLKGGGFLLNKGIEKVGTTFGSAMGIGKAVEGGATGSFSRPQTFLGRFSEKANNFVRANNPENKKFKEVLTKDSFKRKEGGGFSSFRINADLEQYNTRKKERKDALGIGKKSKTKEGQSGVDTTTQEIEAETQAKQKNSQANTQVTQTEQQLSQSKTQTGQAAAQATQGITQEIEADTKDIESKRAKIDVLTQNNEKTQEEIDSLAQRQQALIASGRGDEEIVQNLEKQITAKQDIITANNAEISSLQESIGAKTADATASGIDGAAEEAVEEQKKDVVKASGEEGAAIMADAAEKGVDAAANTGLAASEQLVGTSAMASIPSISAMGAALWTALAPILPVIGAVALGIGAIAAVVAGIKYANEHTAEALAQQAVKTAEEDLNNFEEKTKETQQQIDTLKNSWTSLTDTNNDLSNLIPGTEAFTQKVLEANQQVLALLDTLPELAQYLSVNSSTGLMSIDEAGYKKVLEQKQQELAQNQSNELFASAHLQSKKAEAKLLDDKKEAYSENSILLSSSQVKGLNENQSYRYDSTTGSWGYDVYTDHGSYFQRASAEQEANIDKYLRSDAALKSSDKNISSFVNDYQTAVNSYETTQGVANSTIKSAIATSLANGKTDLSDKQLGANDVASTIMSGAYEAELETQMAHFGNVSESDIWQGGSTGSEFAQYAADMGYTYDSSNQVLKDANGNELYTIDFYGEADRDAVGETKTITNEEAQRLFAKEMVKRNVTNKASEISKLIAGSEYGEDLNKVFSGDFTADIGNAQKMIDKLEKAKIKDKNGVEVSLLPENFNLNQRLEDFKNARKEANTATSSELSKVFDADMAGAIGEDKLSEISQGKKDIQAMVGANHNADVLSQVWARQQAMGQLDVSTEQGAVAAREYLKNSGQENVDDLGTKDLTIAVEQAAERADSLKNYIGTINFDDAIGGAKQLQADLAAGGEAAQNALEVLESIPDAFSATAQVTQLMKGDNFAEINSALTDILNKTGNISASNVRELADQYSDLGMMLDNGTMTASSFAAMMEDVARGEVSLGEVTEDLIQLYNDFAGAADLAGDAIAEFNKHQIGESKTQLGRGYTDSWAAVQDLIERGAWGDSQMGEYMAQLMGDEAWNAISAGKTQKQAVENANALYGFDQNKGNMQGSLQHLLNGQGGSIDFANGGGLSLGSNGQISWDLSGIESSADLINQIAEAFGVSDQYAKALVGDMETFSETLSDQLAELDKGKAVENYLNKHLDAQGNLIGTEAELSTLARQLTGNKNATSKDLQKALTDNGQLTDANGNPVNITSVQAAKQAAGGWAKIDEETGEASFATKDILTEAKQQVSATTKGGKQLAEADALQLPVVASIVADESLTPEIKQDLLEQAGLDEGLATELSVDTKQAQANLETMSGEMTQKVAQAIDSIDQVLASNPITLKPEGAFEIGGIETSIDFGPLGKIPIPIPKLHIPLGGEVSISTAGGGGRAASVGSGPTAAGTGNNYSYTPSKTGTTPKTGDTTYGKNDDTGKGGGGGGGGGSDEDKNAYSAKQAEAMNKALNDDSHLELSNAIADGIDQATNPWTTGVTALEQVGYGDYAGAQDTLQNYFAQTGEDGETTVTNFIDALRDGTDAMRMAFDDIRQYGEIKPDTLNKLPGSMQGRMNDLMPQLQTAGVTGGQLDQYTGEMIEKNNKALEQSEKRMDRISKIQSALNKSQVASLACQVASTTELASQFKYRQQNLQYAKTNYNYAKKEVEEDKDIAKYIKMAADGTVSRTDAYDKLSSAQKKEVDENEKVQTAESAGSKLQTEGDNMFQWGLDMFNGISGIFETGKGIFDTMKGYAEKVAQYITQAIEVVVSAWTNRKDWLYNFLNRIEKELHEFEKLQEYANQIDEGRVVTYQELMKNWDDQWESLQKQLEMQNERVESRQQYLDWSKFIPFSLISGWSPVTDTLYENRTVKFIWDLMIGFGQMMPMFGDVFKSLNELYEDYDKRVQENYEDRLEAEKAILEIETERLKLVKAGAEEATQFEEKVMDAFIQKEQESINELSNLNDAITSANQTLINTLRDNLDEVRQIRENTDTEEDLTDKEQRLAYLRQDTSNANLNEIKKLEKELEDSHESYTDKLIDQRISDLEDQNEKAADQRQKQIDLLQSQLDWAEKYGVYWDQIYGMLYTIDENGNIALNTANFDERGFLRANGELSKLLVSFSDIIGESIWKTVLDNEDLKKLGVYYNAFVQYNGNEGIWRRQDMLTNPDLNDSGYVSWWDDKHAGKFWQFWAKIEDDWNDFWINSDLGLMNGAALMGKRIGDFFRRIWGWLTGQEYESRAEAWIKEGGYKSEHDNDPVTKWFYALFTGQLSSLRQYNRAEDGVNSASAGKWLVGEEGPELIQFANGGAYLAGTQGPEMVNLANGDKVYNNSDTKGIFNRGPSFGRLATGNATLTPTEPKWMENLVNRGIKQIGNLTSKSAENNITTVNEFHFNIEKLSGEEEEVEYVVQKVVDRLDEIARYRSVNVIDYPMR